MCSIYIYYTIYNMYIIIWTRTHKLSSRSVGHFPAATARISEDLTSLTAMVGEGKEITDWCPSPTNSWDSWGAKLMDFDGIFDGDWIFDGDGIAKLMDFDGDFDGDGIGQKHSSARKMSS